MTRRLRFGLLASGIFVFLTILYLSFGSSHVGHDIAKLGAASSDENAAPSQPFGGSISDLGLPDNVLSGGSIAPKLENATLKAELGRASWRLMHTMMARFPEKPTADDSLALQTYVQLFARLYPCGDCASHFQKLLQEYPPQTSSRNAAAGWACFVHNEVNKRLKKELFDCSKIGDFYDCGCGDEGKDGKDGKSKAAGSSGTGDEFTGEADAEDVPPATEAVIGDGADSKTEGAIKVEKEEGLSRGG